MSYDENAADPMKRHLKPMSADAARQELAALKEAAKEMSRMILQMITERADVPDADFGPGSASSYYCPLCFWLATHRRAFGLVAGPRLGSALRSTSEPFHHSVVPRKVENRCSAATMSIYER